MMNVTMIFPDVMVVIQRLDDDWGGADPCSNPAPQEGEICQNLASHGVSGNGDSNNTRMCYPIGVIE
jgi:hypothetical protein